ncbi:VOC family protein [Gramella lutea]|uniref:VOC family protein n=1 Tax=Christiangramia lutea TaxID=1607951 RepID=A0A9X1V4R6_9FLAO|nr:VOC family protein [Christiangramia lutea]MCH4824392.1 VOC family protein [Christiangramia lutea]
MLLKITINQEKFLLILFMLLAASGIAQEDDNKNDKDPGKFHHTLTLQHTTMVVSNFARSEEFYKGILKLKDLNADWLPEKQMFLSLGNNLELHVGEVPGVEINPGNFNHFALSTKDLDGFLNYLKDKGIVYSSLGGNNKYKVQKRPDGVRQTFIQDPDGYWIEINDANKY